MSSVCVVDTAHRPLDLVHPGHARGQAAVWKRHPLALLLKRAVPQAPPQPLRLKLDPTSRTTGQALLSELQTPAAQRAAVSAGRVVWAGEIHHRGRRVPGVVV